MVARRSQWSAQSELSSNSRPHLSGSLQFRKLALAMAAASPNRYHDETGGLTVDRCFRTHGNSASLQDHAL